MDGKTYAADSNGVYVYDAGNRTWQTLTTEVTAGQYDQLNAANGKLSISANSGNNTLPRYTQMAILSVDSKTTEIVDTTIFVTGGAAYYVINSTGLSYAGVPYFYYSGPIFNNNQDRMTVLCRYEGEGEDAAWIRVKESAFWSDSENPNQFATKVRPASINVCVNPAAGVTLHGQTFGHSVSSGSLYLETASTTITFDPNGGTLNGAESVTGQIYSEIPVSVRRPPHATAMCSAAGVTTPRARPHGRAMTRCSPQRISRSMPSGSTPVRLTTRWPSTARAHWKA